MKCYLTGEKCTADRAGYWDGGDSCPIQKYRDSSRREGGRLIIDDYCRYYGITRAKELQKAFEEV